MNTKAKGSRSEKKTIELLEAQGYYCCKAGASLGLWDIIAISTVDIVVVQVKSNRWPERAETELLVDFRGPPNCKKQIWRWDDRVKLPKVRNL